MCLNGTERKVKTMADLDKATAMHQYLKEQERKKAEQILEVYRQYLKEQERKKAKQILEAYRQSDDKNALERAVILKRAINKPADRTK